MNFLQSFYVQINLFLNILVPMKKKTLNVSTMFNLRTMIHRIDTNILVVAFIVSIHYHTLMIC